MNTALEQKLKDLWQESLKQNALEVHVVIHLLLANYHEKTHGDFARWCCQFSNGLKMDTTIDGSKQVLPGELPSDFPNNSGNTEWIC
jgi:hypothetical protein